MDYPIPVMPPLPLTHTWSAEMLGVWQNVLCNTNLISQASAAYPAANRIIYIPFGLAMPATIVKLWVYNGAFTGSPNLNMGIYDVAGTRIVQIGTTAQSGASVLQVFDIADTLIGPGDFYLAIIATVTTAQMIRTAPGDVGFCRAMGMLQEAGSGSTLPTTATFATVASAYIPQIGFSTRADV